VLLLLLVLRLAKELAKQKNVLQPLLLVASVTRVHHAQLLAQVTTPPAGVVL
jgi:hypothetical protein